MTVAELQAALQAAIDRGLPPSTTVVLDNGDWYSVAEVGGDPSTPEAGYDLWFTLHQGADADSRFTPGGMPDE